MIKLYLKYLVHIFFSSVQKQALSLNTNKKRCFVCLAADYGNLGDVAITYAQTEFLKQKYPDYEIVDFPISQTVSLLKSLKKNIAKDDIITIVGGGNMGDMYYEIELLRLLIVKHFPTNKIISFPQTIDYSSSSFAKKLLNFSRKIYSNHRDLILCAREEVSYCFMKDNYPNCRVLLMPDIVMSLDKSTPTFPRSGVTLCLRDDKEKGPFSHKIKELQSLLWARGKEVRYYDTHISKNQMSVTDRIQELNKIWEVFKRSEFIITDRLHGMIFAFITKTPAIVFPNSNFKIRKCYEWIKKCEYIYFVDDESCDVKELLLMKKIHFSFNDVQDAIRKTLDKMPL